MTQLKYVIMAALWAQLITAAVHNDTAYGIIIPEKPTKSITRPSKGISEKTHKTLQHSHTLIEQKEYKAAEEKLKSLIDRVASKPHELAQVLQTLGYVYAHQENYSEAAKSFQKAIDFEALPASPTLTSLYTLAQLQVMSKDFKGALTTLQEWFYLSDAATADALILGATCYVELKDYKAALPLAKQAVKLSEKPKESWYQMLLSIQFSLKDYQAAALTLQDVIGLWPKEAKYYKQLSAIHLTNEDYVNALAIAELAYKQGFTIEERDLMNLANLYLINEIPYRAALLVDQELNAGRIAKSRKSYELMASAWHRAKDMKQAIVAYNHAAQISDDPKLFVTIGQLHAENEDWQHAIESYQKALKTKKLKNTGEVQLALGIAKFYSEDKNGAIASLKIALAEADTKNQAEKWLAFVEQK